MPSAYGIKWTADNNVRVFWDGAEIGVAENPGSGRWRDSNGNPSGVSEFVTDWLASQSIPNDVGYADAIMMCIVLEAGNFQERQ